MVAAPSLSAVTTTTLQPLWGSEKKFAYVSAGGNQNANSSTCPSFASSGTVGAAAAAALPVVEEDDKCLRRVTSLKEEEE